MDEINDEIPVDDFVSDFAKETVEILDSIDSDLIALKKYAPDVPVALIERIYRAIHSIKGGSGFAGFTSLSNMTKALLEVLAKIRDGEVPLEPDVVAILLSGTDKVREMGKNIYASNNIPFQETRDKLKSLLSRKLEKQGQSVSGSSLPESEFIDFSETQPLLDESEPLDEELVHDFIDDIREMLDSIEPDLLVMEQEKENVEPALINRIFRRIHSIKGGAGFCGFSSLKIMSHGMENLLMRIRDGKLKLNSEIIDAFLLGIDKIRVMIENIDSQELIPFQEELDCLNAFLDEPVSVVEKEGSTAEHRKPSAPEKAAFSEKKFRIDSPEGKDLDVFSINRMGEYNSETIRISLGLAEHLMNLAGELVLGRNQLRQSMEKYIIGNPQLGSIIQNIDIVTSEIQENIMRMRMQPIGNVLNKFPRVIRDLSRQVGKEIHVSIEGAEAELDKTLLEKLKSPLDHLIRNCVDHGIEYPSQRVIKDKPRIGQIHLNAYHEGGQVNIIIQDDGVGIDAEKIAEKVVADGLMTKEHIQRMDRNEILALIFLPGVSTARMVTDISGRGVGMDVVKTNIETIGGNIDIESIPDKGTKIHITIPLTLAIIPALIVGVEDSRFAIPQISVQELVCIKGQDTEQRLEKIGDSLVLRLRGKLIPIVRLADVLGIRKTFIHPETGEVCVDRRERVIDRRTGKLKKMDEEYVETESVDEQLEKRYNPDRRRRGTPDMYVVVLRLGMNSFGVSVDQLHDNEEIVVKPLSVHIKSSKPFAGATIMGDGRVAMILDPVGIAAQSKLRFSEIKTEEKRRRKKMDDEKIADESLQSIIIFNNSPDEFFALPLNVISRLEIIKPDSIRRVGDREYFSFRGDGLPLIRLEKLLPVNPLPEIADELFVIIPKSVRSQVGIIVSKIIDTIDIDMKISRFSTTPRGMEGSIILNGSLVSFLNIEEVLDIFENRLFINDKVRNEFHPPRFQNGVRKPDGREL